MAETGFSQLGGLLPTLAEGSKEVVGILRRQDVGVAFDGNTLQDLE